MVRSRLGCHGDASGAARVGPAEWLSWREMIVAFFRFFIKPKKKFLSNFPVAMVTKRAAPPPLSTWFGGRAEISRKHDIRSRKRAGSIPNCEVIWSERFPNLLSAGVTRGGRHHALRLDLVGARGGGATCHPHAKVNLAGEVIVILRKFLVVLKWRPLICCLRPLRGKLGPPRRAQGARDVTMVTAHLKSWEGGGREREVKQNQMKKMK